MEAPNVGYFSTRLYTQHDIPGEHNLKLVLLPESNYGLKEGVVVS